MPDWLGYKAKLVQPPKGQMLPFEEAREVVNLNVVNLVTIGCFRRWSYHDTLVLRTVAPTVAVALLTIVARLLLCRRSSSSAGLAKEAEAGVSELTLEQKRQSLEERLEAQKQSEQTAEGRAAGAEHAPHDEWHRAQRCSSACLSSARVSSAVVSSSSRRARQGPTE